MKCPKCGAESSSPTECSICGIIFEKFEHSKSLEHQRELKAEFQSLDAPAIPKSVDLWLPPIAAIVCAGIFSMIPLFVYVIGAWTHEFGHAFIAWFGGIAATPLPILLFTSMHRDPSWFVTICFTTLLVLLSYKSIQSRYYFLTITFICLFIAQIYFRFFVSTDSLRTAVAFGGIAGEFWVSAWVVMAYHYQFPEKAQWPILRYVFLVAACLSFFHNYFLWRAVLHGTKAMPGGSAWGGDGDMEYLQYISFWTPEEITHRYLVLGYICLSVMIIHYLGQLAFRFSRVKEPSLKHR